MLIEIAHRIVVGMAAGNAIALPILALTGVAIAAVPIVGIGLALAAPKAWRFARHVY